MASQVGGGVYRDRRAQWDQWVVQLRKVQPSEHHAVVDIPLDHPMLPYFYTFGPRGYAFGINVLLYAMTY